jgi:hypothetical protein
VPRYAALCGAAEEAPAVTRVCTICRHEQREAIDRAVVAGRSHRAVAADFGVSDDAITRHSAAHLPAALLKAKESDEAAHALDVVKQLKAINGASLQILNEARLAGNSELVLKAVDRVLRQVELQAKLLGELDERPQVNVLLAPEWVSIRGTVLAALAPFPEARAAVAQQLLALEGSNGHHG